jgi:hypothetical protein
VAAVTSLRPHGIGLVAGLLLLLAPGAARAQEVSRGEQPTPDSVEDLGGALQGAFVVEEPEPGIPRLTRMIQNLPPFLRDTKLSFNARTYYFDHWRLDDTRGQTWAIGGGLEYRSGWAWDRLAVGAAVYTSQRIVGKKSRGGTGLLRPVQESYTVAGQGYAELRFAEGDHRVTAYRQVVDLPYVNKADTRMTPSTFEAYLARGVFRELPWLGDVNYVAGWIPKIRRRDQDEFQSMSQVAGAASGDHGAVSTTFRIRPLERTYLGVTNHYVKDTFNTFYVEGSWVQPLTDDLSLRFGGQFTHQTSVGKEQLPSSPFDTWNVSFQLAASWRRAILTLATSTTSRELQIQNPWGTYPGYLGLMQSDFNRAGEDAWLLGLSYDFKEWGIPALSFFTNYAEGYDVSDPRNLVENERTWDVTVDYRVPEGWAKDLWVRVRGSLLWTTGEGKNSQQVRVVLNWELPIL